MEKLHVKPVKRTQDDMSVDCQQLTRANEITLLRDEIEGLKREKEMMESRIQLLEHEKQRLQERLDRTTIRRVLNPTIRGIPRKRGQFPS
jgi:predicted nuclease with TOPRIM domain